MISEAEPVGTTGTRHTIIEAFEALGRGLACVTFSVHGAHPDEGCLPLPVLRVAHSLGGLRTYAAEVEATLWHNTQYWAPAWTRALTSCAHGLDPYGISTTFGLIHAWRALVSRAADHAAGHESHDGYGLDGRLVLLAWAGQKVTALSEAHHG